MPFNNKFDKPRVEETKVDDSQKTPETRAWFIVAISRIRLAILLVAALAVAGCPPKYKDFEMTEDAGTDVESKKDTLRLNLFEPIKGSLEPEKNIAQTSPSTPANVDLEALKIRDFETAKAFMSPCQIDIWQRRPGSYFDKHIGNVVTPGQQTVYLATDRLLPLNICTSKNSEGLRKSLVFKETAGRALQSADEKMQKETGQCLWLESAFRSDNYNCGLYQQRLDGKDNLAGKPGDGMHSLGQALDLNSRMGTKGYKTAREYLIAAGWLDTEQGDCGHFEFRTGYSDGDRAVSGRNGFLCGKGGMWAKLNKKVLRPIVKYGRKAKRAAGKLMRKIRGK